MNFSQKIILITDKSSVTWDLLAKPAFGQISSKFLINFVCQCFQTTQWSVIPEW